MHRPPDFVIIGAMKAGTTTLFRWLEEHPECRMPEVKEPDFFIDERAWRRGTDWYLSLFDRPPGFKSGEASVGYTDPELAHLAASRMAEVLPDAKLLFLARNPVDRLRSHYRHEVQRGRESQPMTEALAEGSRYVERSLYSKSLGPFLAAFPHEQLRIVIFESLYESPSGVQTWAHLLEYLGISVFPAPGMSANVSADKEGFSSLVSWAWDRGIRKVPGWVPRSWRSKLKGVLLRDDTEYRELIGSSQSPIAPLIVRRLKRDVEVFAEMVGIERPWELSSSGTSQS